MKYLKEFLWILISLLVVLIVLFPIYTQIEYKYLYINSLIIFVSVFYIRATLDLRNIFYLKSKWIRYLFFSFNLFLFIYFITRIQSLIVLYDNFSITAFASEYVFMSPTLEANLLSYIQKEFLFFGIISLVSIFVLNSKIIKSFWSKKYFNIDEISYRKID